MPILAAPDDILLPPISQNPSDVPLMIGAAPLKIDVPALVTAAMLEGPCPSAHPAIASGCATALSRWLPAYGIDDSFSICLLTGQMAEESDHWRTMEEYASGREYEGRRDLGNTVRGDGILFKGRGPLQATGRANYRHYGAEVIDPTTGQKGVDLVAQPHRAAEYDIGIQIAILYAREHGIFTIAKNPKLSLYQKIVAVTHKVNGGVNGLAERQRLTLAYLKAAGH